jgi:AraC-like DNA-binding protein
MENAGRLLTYSNYPLKQAAWECGYPDISYFGRSFKNHFGLSPARFQSLSGAADPIFSSLASTVTLNPAIRPPPA